MIQKPTSRVHARMAAPGAAQEVIPEHALAVALDWRWFGVTLICNRAQQLRQKAEGLKRHQHELLESAGHGSKPIAGCRRRRDSGRQ
jgi:hypothetical protein